MTRALVISSYPLTAPYRARIEKRMSVPPDYVTVSTLRERGLSVRIRAAWASRPRRVIVASESESSRKLEAAVCTLAVLLHGWPILVAGPSGEPVQLSLSELLAYIRRLAGASTDSMWARLVAALAARGPVMSPHTFHGSIESWAGIKILYIKNVLSTGLSAGGSVGHVAGVVNALVAGGANVRMITTEPSPTVREEVEERHPSGMDVFGVPAQANVFRMQRQTVRCAEEVVGTWKPDFLYQRLTLGDCSGEILARRYGVPLITEYNGSEVWCNTKWGAGVRYAREFLRAEDRMLRSSALVFTISKVLRDELLARGIPPTRVGWYPNGIDPAKYDPSRFSESDRFAVRREIGLQPDDFVITFVGTFGDWHGADVLARAISAGCAPGGPLASPCLRFVFVGDGKNRQKAEGIVQESGHSERCRFLGLVPQAETPRILAASDCFVSPHVPNPDGTEFFGSPTKLFEYMAMARPIVASRLGQIGDVLEHGVTAVLVEPGDASELARAIGSVAADPIRGRALAEKARAEALKRFTWAAHVEHLRKCLSQVCGG